MAVAILALLLLVLTQCDDDDSTSDDTSSTTYSDTSSTTPTDSGGAATATASPSASETTTAPSPTSSATGDAGAGTGAAGAGSGTLTAGSTILLPMSGSTPAGDLTTLAGQPAAAQGVQVLTVPADEGFWVGTSDTDRVWVQLSASGESPYQVKAGDLIDFTGTMLTHEAGFAAQVGVSADEGAEQLSQQMAHVEADRTTVVLSAG